ncbi:MAG: hypothetical protein QG622_2380 [Actinomycetota bacterium]|nr:hypothetical protein [Actinomycetota bacterium]
MSTKPRGPFVCNLKPSPRTTDDWGFADSLEAGLLTAPQAAPPSVDLREDWWTVGDQETTGSCVGWATADGVLRWTFVTAGKISPQQGLSARFIWMASKETDQFVARPQTFVEEAGTSLKAAMDVARKYGAALLDDVPFHLSTSMYAGSENSLYARCARLKVASYFNLNRDLPHWRTWLATNGPVLTGVQVDESWMNAPRDGTMITDFRPETVRGGHAVCVVGYREDGAFIVRNSWGTSWGDSGFAYVSPEYVTAAFFQEAYGVTVS